MASILRSSKFVRYIAGFARNIVVNTPREFDGNFVNTTHCFCGAVPRSFATEASAQHDQGLDRRLRTLDQDVRRSGRISRRDIEDVLEEIRQSRSATSSQSLLVIRCCGSLVPEELPETRTKLVQEIWNTLKRLNVPMDISHYNALLRVYLENEHPFSPTEFLADLEAKGIEPNRVTYQRLIARYCQDGDIEGATRILEFMKEKQLPVNENVFNALINGHSQAGDMDSAHGILTVMTQAGLEPSADTYTTLICGYAKQGDIDKILSLIAECEEKEIYLLDKDLLDISYALIVNGHEEHVEKILSKTRKQFGYNQDAINVILRLLNRGCEDASYTILKSMPRSLKEDGNPYPSGQFFIKQLVKANRPIETILKYCDSLKGDGFLDNSLILATEYCLHIGNDELALRLFDKLKENGMPVRQHYFWPLLKAKSQDKSGKSIVQVLSEMTRFNLTPSPETIREYVMPYMSGSSSDIISKLREANISVGSAASSLVYSLLTKNDMAEAAVIASKVPAYYQPDYIRKPLASAFYKTKDLKSYLTIVRHVYENIDRKEVVTDNDNTDQSEVVGKFILDLATSPRLFVEEAENILSGLVDQGLSISAITAQKLEEKLGEKMTPNISTLLGKLSSGELTPVPIEKKSPTYTPASMMNVAQLERLIFNLEAKGQDTKGLKRQLLSLYYREKSLDKMLSLLKGLEKDGYIYTTGTYIQLLDTYVHHEKLDEAVETLNKIKEDPEMSLDEIKIMRLVELFIKKDKFDNALDLIKSRAQRKSTDERGYNYTGLCWRILNHLAEQGKDEELDILFTNLLEKDFIDISNSLLGPLIKVHLHKNDVDKALEKFEYCCNQFKSTPWKNELTKKLIEMEDAENLQKLTDLSTLVHGEINSLYDLVFSFVECGRNRQARKILETPGLQSRPGRINLICQRYQMEGRIKPLESLRDVTKDLNHIDRSDIYYQLLLSYLKQDESEKALSLWTQMQEEDLAPTDEFLVTLGNYLKTHNMEVPFAIPEEPPMENVSILKAPKRTVQEDAPRRGAQSFRQALKAGDLTAAVEIGKTVESILPSDQSLLIEKLIQKERLEEAKEITFKMLKAKQVPLTRVFRFLLNRLANAGDTETLEKIGSYINADTKKLISFDNRICHSNLINGKASEYLNVLENTIDSAKDEELQAIGEKFPRGGAIGILERHPELEDKYRDIAVKYAKRGIVSPVNVLWAHYFVTNKFSEADSLWNDYLTSAPRIMFQRVVQHARETKNEVLASKLIEHLKVSNVTEGAIGNAYSCLLDILVAKEKNEEIISNFEKAAKDVNIEHLNRTAVIRVKEVYEKLGKEFTYKIPAKSNKHNTSSDEDNDHK